MITCFQTLLALVSTCFNCNPRPSIKEAAALELEKERRATAEAGAASLAERAAEREAGQCRFTPGTPVVVSR